jgi:hypothetical protein
MADYEIPPEALGNTDDDMETVELTTEDIRKTLAAQGRRTVVLDKHGLPRRVADLGDPQLMKAAKATGPVMALAHRIGSIFNLGAPTHIRATGSEDSIDVRREYNRTTGKPELRVDVNAPPTKLTRLEKLRGDQGPDLERRKEIDPKAEASQQKSRENRRKPFWLD